jgi:hypothetical protein
MIPQKQMYRHRPDEGMIGDCHRTAIACLLDLPKEEVPHFALECFEQPDRFHDAFENWLKERGWRTFTMPFSGDQDLTEMLQSINTLSRGALFILGGESRTGVNHSVIAGDGRIVWDPSLDDAGITGPCDDGYYWVTLLVPTRMFLDDRPAVTVVYDRREVL